VCLVRGTYRINRAEADIGRARCGIEPKVGFYSPGSGDNISLERSKRFQEGLRLTELDFAAG
jgi:hypothetical protein